MKTKAVIFTGQNQVEFGDVETPDPGPNDVVVRTTHSWISNGTEGSFLRKERYDGVTPWQQFMPEPYPMVAGYQKVGIVEWIGADVKGFRPGQSVFATITKVKQMHLGFGGHMAAGPCDANEVFALPEGLDPVAYSGLVLTQVGYNSGTRPAVQPGTRAMVVGDGMVGQWAAQTLQNRGAKVLLCGRRPNRLALFEAREGDLALNGHDADWFARALEWAGGAFEIVVDTVGNEVNFDLNLKLIAHLAHDSHWVTTGHEGFKAWMDLKQFIYHETTVHTPCGWTRQRLEATLGLIAAGKLKTLPLITDHLPAAEAREAWRRISENKQTLGVILDWE
jgi:2-desacetyl-2-hydroxyethyl bacteriochlorophyllide A dehydrogenase